MPIQTPHRLLILGDGPSQPGPSPQLLLQVALSAPCEGFAEVGHRAPARGPSQPGPSQQLLLQAALSVHSATFAEVGHRAPAR